MLRKFAAAFMALCMTMGVIAAEAGETRIVADPTAPGNQQPQVLQTAGGLPQVNINTPNSGGMSYNRYQQFDVGSQGAILNNSNKNVQTQLGGWVQANPNLIGGGANLIVNEVNSTRPSQLGGFVEVAGQRADVVIANPSGISVDGGGFINANRVTLTTGKPIIENGNLTGYRVTEGQVNIYGAGLNAKDATATDIIAESVKVNAGVFANQLNIVAGKNIVSRDASQVTVLSPDAETGVSIDVKHLGGMYANEIRLVGTGRGVGVNSVNNSGVIAAQVGEVVIDANGMLTSSGIISGQQGVRLNGGDEIANTGRVQSGGVVSMNGAQSIDNSGEILGDGGVNMRAAVDLDNTGLLQSRGNSSLTTANGSFHNSGDILVLGDTSIVAKQDIVNTGSIENGGDMSIVSQTGSFTNSAAGEILAGGDLAVKAETGIDNAGLIQAQGDMAIVSNAGIANQGDILAGGSASLVANGGNLTNTGSVQGQDGLELSTSGNLANSGLVLSGDNAHIDVTGSVHNSGEIGAANALTLNAGGNLTNVLGGSILADESYLTAGGKVHNTGLVDGGIVQIRASSIENVYTGTILGNYLSLGATSILNGLPLLEDGTGMSGLIGARTDLYLGAGSITNREDGMIYVGRDLWVGGNLDAAGYATGRADSFLNSSATIDVGGNIVAAVDSFTNYNAHYATEVREVTPENAPFTAFSKNTYDMYKEGSPGTWFGYGDDEYGSINYEQIKDFYIHNVSTREYDTFVVSTRPGFIYGGGTFTLDGNLTNDKSELAVGALQVTGGTFTNIGAWEPYRVDTTNKFQWTWWEWHGGLFNDPERHYEQWQYRYSSDTTHRLKSVLPAGYSRNLFAAPNQAATSTGATLGPIGLNLNSNMYSINSTPTARYVVETNPRLTNYREWLSSDFMLSMLASDPQNMLKRLGDGFYEQRLIREQLIALAGRRFLDGFTSDEEQYQALMTAGVEFAKEFSLDIGVTLSAELMARLTTDIVWLEYVTVDTANGPVQALAPKVYLAPGRENLLDVNGGLVAANKIKLDLTGDMNNSGSLYGSELVQVKANDINNSGAIAGKLVSLAALRDINNIGGTITGVDAVALKAGNDLNIASTTQSYSYANEHGSGLNSNIDKVGVVQMTSETGTMILEAGRDIKLKTGVIDSAGTTALVAERDITVSGTNVGFDQRTQADSRNNTHVSGSEDVGSQIYAGGDLAMLAGRDLTITGSGVYSDGALSLAAENDVTINEGRSKLEVEHNIYYESKGVFTSRSKEIHGREKSDLAVGSDISGNTVEIAAGNDFNLRGSSVAASEGLAVATDGDINILGADNDTETYRKEVEKKSGFGASFSGGRVGVSYSKSEKGDEITNREHFITGSLIGSENGLVSLYAGKDVGIAGSQVVAGTGDILISGENVNIVNQYNTYDTWKKHYFKQSGFSLSIGLSGALGDAVQAAVNLSDTAQRMQEAKSNRAQTLYGIAAARNAYDLVNSGRSLASVASAPSGGVVYNSGGVVGLSASVGFNQTKNESTYQSHDQLAVGSSITSGGATMIVARGVKDGEGVRSGTGDLNIIGSTVDAGGWVSLYANNDINLMSAEEVSTYSQTNKGSSSGIGASVNIGSSGFGITVDLSASKNKGNGSGTTITHAETIVRGREGVEFTSENDTTLRGAQIIGDTVIGTIGGDLTIISEQDTSTHNLEQSSWGGSLSIPVWGYSTGSASFNSQSQKGNSDYASVNEQSGIFAGKGGFDIEVGGHTGLKGAVIASEADPDKNILVTGSISTEDIQNHSNYEAKTKGWGIETSGTKGSISPSLPMKDSGGDSSTTKSSVAPGTVIVTDEKEQLARTGQTAEEAIASLNRDVDNAHSGPLDKNPNLQDLLDRQAELADAAAQAGRAVATTVGDISQAMYEKTGDDGWKEGGIYKTIMQGAGAALVAQLGNGEGLNAALGAMASQLAAGKVNDAAKNISQQITSDPNQQELLANLISGVISSSVGFAVGGESGANSASYMDRYNRQIHKEEFAKLRELAKIMAEETGVDEEIIYLRLEAAASALVHRYEGYPEMSAEFQKYKFLAVVGEVYCQAEMALLMQYKDQIFYHDKKEYPNGYYNGDYIYHPFVYTEDDKFYDYAHKGARSSTAGTRLIGAGQAAGGAIETIAGAKLAAATGGLAGIPAYLMVAQGTDNFFAGIGAVWTGAHIDTLAATGLKNFGFTDSQAAAIEIITNIVVPYSAVKLAKLAPKGGIISIDNPAHNVAQYEQLKDYYRAQDAIANADEAKKALQELNHLETIGAANGSISSSVNLSAQSKELIEKAKYLDSIGSSKAAKVGEQALQSVYEDLIRQKTSGISMQIDGIPYDCVTDTAIIEAKAGDSALSNVRGFLNPSGREQILRTIDIANRNGKVAEFWFKLGVHDDVRAWIVKHGGKVKIGLGE